MFYSTRSEDCRIQVIIDDKHTKISYILFYRTCLMLDLMNSLIACPSDTPQAIVSMIDLQGLWIDGYSSTYISLRIRSLGCCPFSMFSSDKSVDSWCEENIGECFSKVSTLF